MNWFKSKKPKHDPASTQDLLKALERDPGSVWTGPASQGKAHFHAVHPSLATTTQWAEQLMDPPAPGDGADTFDAVQTREVLAALLYAAQVAGVEVDQVQQWARTHSRAPGELLRPHALRRNPKGAQMNPDAHTAYLALAQVQRLSEHPRTEIMSRVASALTRAQNRTTP